MSGYGLCNWNLDESLLASRNFTFKHRKFLVWVKHGKKFQNSRGNCSWDLRTWNFFLLQFLLFGLTG